MLDPTLRAAFVVIVAAALKLGADAAGIPLDTATLTAIAIGIVAWIFGNPAGKSLALAINVRRNRNRAQ